jgi:hypothetical protein
METKEWVLPNRVYFNKWVYNQFHPSKYTTKKQGVFSPEPYQQLIKDFVHYSSPYRGLLVYHGLGTGKTCTSILATESFINNKSKVIVLTPASLENNFRKELKKCSNTGYLLRKKWTKVKLDYKLHYEVYDSLKDSLGLTKTFIDKHNGNLWLPFLPKNIPTDTIISEPTFVRSMEQEDIDIVNEIYEFIINDRYTFLHYNGLTNKKLDELEQKNQYNKDIFDDTIVIIDEVHTFISRVVGGGKIARRLYNLLLYKPNIKLVMLSGTPVINNPFELCYTLNLLRGPIEEYSISMLKDKDVPSVEQVKEVLKKENLFKYIDDIIIDNGSNQIKLTLMPNGFVKKDDTVLIEKGSKIYNKQEWITKMITKMKKHLDINARIKQEDFTALPLNKDNFYELFFKDYVLDQDKIKLFMKRITGIVSYFNTNDINSYPEQLPTLYNKVPMSGTQYKYYVEVRNKEIKNDEKQRKKQARNVDGLFNTNSSYRAFSRMACNYVFPNEIKRPFPSDIYGKILRRELDIGEDEDIEDKYSGKIDIMKEYEKDLSKALTSLEENASKYLQDEGLHESSPKMKELLHLLTTQPSKSLLYSQFRSVEGLRIFRMILNNAGWIEVDFKSKGKNDWEIVNSEEVLNSKYDGKRYILFGDKNKTDIIINLFNADMKFLPSTIQKQLTTAKLTENLRGNLVSLLMITQSGAEGLNLRNVRNVYILEPFWNQVRINQVIGRAVRKNSHLELPEDERNVQPMIFLSTFNKNQAKANKTIQFKDNALTTDENVFDIAINKDKIVQDFLRLIKSNSFDCIFNANMNKPLMNNYSCFSYPINIENETYNYLPNLHDDDKLSSFKKVEKERKIKGKVVLKDDVKYIMLPNDETLYDYQAYKDTHILIASKYQ